MGLQACTIRLSLEVGFLREDAGKFEDLGVCYLRQRLFIVLLEINNLKLILKRHLQIAKGDSSNTCFLMKVGFVHVNGFLG